MKAWFGGATAVVAFGLIAVLTQGGDGEAQPAKPVETQAAPVLPATPTPQQVAPRRHALRAVDYALVDARMRRLIADPHMVGLAIGIVEDGQITYLRGYGEALRGSGEPVTADTVFRWASVSKGVASTLVAGLAAEGKLSLGDPAARYARSLRLPNGGEAQATIADVLSHRVGLPSNSQDPKLEDGGNPRQLRGELAAVPPICPIGTCHAYQNVAYDSASEIVEKVTGKPYADVAAERLFRPLGMASASVSLVGLVSSPSWAHPHDGSGRMQVRGLSEAYYRVPAAGGVNSSIRDMARWLQAQMGEAPRALPVSLLDTIHAPRVDTPRETRRQVRLRERIKSSTYGYGWRNYEYAGRRLVGHHGGISGYRAALLFDPEKRSGVVALWNSGASAPWGIEFEVMDMIQRLPRRDWLGIDAPRPAPGAQPVFAPPPVSETTLAQIGR